MEPVVAFKDRKQLAVGEILSNVPNNAKAVMVVYVDQAGGTIETAWSSGIDRARAIGLIETLKWDLMYDGHGE